jgi:hypothetical protein
LTAPVSWPRRLGIETRNVAVAMVLSVVVLAVLVGLVIALTAVFVH